MSSNPRLAAVALLLLAALGFAAVGCNRLASPSGWASPTITDGLLLVAHKDKLYAFDPNTLTAKWRFPPDGGKNNPSPVALYGTPAGSASTIFIPAYNGNLYSVVASSGALGEKAFATDGPLVGGVAVSGNTIYFGSSDGKVYAIAADTGKQTWFFESGKEVWSTPVPDGDTVYVTSLDGKLYALDAANGTRRWAYDTSAGVASNPVIDHATGVVYLAGFDGELRAVDLGGTHQQRWAVKAGNWFWTRPLLDNGTLYAGSLDDKVYAVDVANGQARWPAPFKADAPIRAGPVMARGKLIVVDRGGHVFGLTPSDGTMSPGQPLKLGADVLADPLVLPDGKVLFVTTGGEMIRVDPATLTIVDRKQVA